MRACIQIVGTDILCRQDGARRDEDVRIALNSEVLSRLRDWSGQYDRVVRSNDPSLLLGLGSEMFAWLDESGWASKWAKRAGDRILEIAVDSPESEAAEALLDLPWEALACDGDFLAADPAQVFVVYRSIGRHADAVPTEPEYGDLRAMFMAAAPEDQRELDFEAEEVAILDALVREARTTSHTTEDESGKCQPQKSHRRALRVHHNFSIFAYAFGRIELTKHHRQLQ